MSNKGGSDEMKHKLMMLLAVLLTGGMLVACGPGEDEATDTTGDAGVVDEPLTEENGVDTDLGADMTAEETEPLAEEEAEDPDATVELTPDEEAAEAETAETEDAAADQTPGDADVAQEETEQQDAQAQAEEQIDAEGDVAGGGAAAPAEGEAITVTLTQAAEGVSVENVQGAQDAQQVASTEETNPELTLSSGQRYEFSWDGEGDLVFYDSNDQPIFSTAGTDSEFANDEEVNAVMESDQIAFTVTEDLAQQLARYAAGPDEQGASVTVN